MRLFLSSTGISGEEFFVALFSATPVSFSSASISLHQYYHMSRWLASKLANQHFSLPCPVNFKMSQIFVSTNKIEAF